MTQSQQDATSGEPQTPSVDGSAVDASVRDASGPGDPLRLTDFVDVTTLQEIQDAFNALTRLSASIQDAEGNPLTEPTDTDRRAEADGTLDWLLDGDEATPGGDRPLVAPIRVDGRTLGSIVVDSHGGAPAQPSRAALAIIRQAVEGLPLDDEHLERLAGAAMRLGPNRAAGVQFLDILANSLARLCFQEHQLRQRLDELSVLYRLSTLLAAHRDLQEVLDVAARSAAEVMGVRSVMIRLLEPASHELIARCVYNLSEQYLNKGPMLLSQSQLAKAAMTGEVTYVEDMSHDERVVYPEQAEREGLVSLLLAGLVYQGRQIGVIELFTGEKRRFTETEITLLKAISQLLAAAIQNTQLDAQRMENQRMQRQLMLASDVQKRMLPRTLPAIAPFDIAARCVPSFELGGDFYDFIDLKGHLGIAVGDVVGKGIAASLLMASVRSSLRAFTQDVFDLDEIISRVNKALTRDTLDNEFATLWYGVLDPRSMRLTYCNAGHEPALLLRNDEVIRLDIGGMIVGIDEEQHYDRSLIYLQPGDMLLAYTDGLVDAQNFTGESFGRDRIIAAMREAADRPARDALNHVLWQMRRFIGLNRAIDDTTLVVVKVGEKTPAYEI